MTSGDQVDPAYQDGEAALTDLSWQVTSQTVYKTFVVRKLKLKQLCRILKQKVY